MNSKKDFESAIMEYLDKGGEVTVLRPASQRDQNKARRMQYHRARALSGSERSQKFLDAHKEKEASFIFSKEERWSDRS